ncbi:DUF3253 domain-containing protein [Ancylobacter sp. TS-1]|uniref:DUF3253 domain-containing protein n=1 Tax=Ancylobacter sp. TS-1 TaxID=1850374 RepID=UPI001265B9D4|nr:DUF3253 domain-containing protein [Ancylobacter sp. TS-1]QFR32167.1 DUF3253 domain-containing protein [Ancylobacter sp. TS-1]
MNDNSSGERTVRPSEEAAEAAILAVAAQPGAGRSVAPEEVARSLATGPDWQSLLPLVRRAAVRLAGAGRLVIYRKGKPVDPAELRGVYRLGLPPQG